MTMRITYGAEYTNKATGKTTKVIGVYTTEILYKSDFGPVSCTPSEFRAWFDRVKKAGK